MNFEYSQKVKDLQEKVTHFMNENVYENENSKKLIISDKEDIEKVGDVGKEVGREALGNV